MHGRGVDGGSGGLRLAGIVEMRGLSLSSTAREEGKSVISASPDKDAFWHDRFLLYRRPPGSLTISNFQLQPKTE